MLTNDHEHFFISHMMFQKIVSFQSCNVAVVDNDKANIINCTEKKWVRTIRLWSGPMTRDMKYGLGAPNKGGLYLVDLTTGNNLATFIQPGQEGVFTRLTGRGGKDSAPPHIILSRIYPERGLRLVLPQRAGHHPTVQTPRRHHDRQLRPRHGGHHHLLDLLGPPSRGQGRGDDDARHSGP